jgi:hypothetical protein
MNRTALIIALTMASIALAGGAVYLVRKYNKATAA